MKEEMGPDDPSVKKTFSTLLRTGFQILVPMFYDSEMPVTLTPKDLMSFSGLFRHVCVHASLRKGNGERKNKASQSDLLFVRSWGLRGCDPDALTDRNPSLKSFQIRRESRDLVLLWFHPKGKLSLFKLQLLSLYWKVAFVSLTHMTPSEGIHPSVLLVFSELQRLYTALCLQFLALCEHCQVLRNKRFDRELYLVK